VFKHLSFLSHFYCAHGGLYTRNYRNQNARNKSVFVWFSVQTNSNIRRSTWNRPNFRLLALNLYVVYNSRFVGAIAKLRKVTICFVLSVRPSVCPSAWSNSAPTGRIFMKFDIWVFFENYIKIRQEYSVRYMKTNIHFRS